MKLFEELFKVLLKDLEQYVIDNMGCVAYLKEQNGFELPLLSAERKGNVPLSFYDRVETCVLTTQERSNWAKSFKTLEVTAAKVKAVATFLDATWKAIRPETVVELKDSSSKPIEQPLAGQDSSSVPLKINEQGFVSRNDTSLLFMNDKPPALIVTASKRKKSKEPSLVQAIEQEQVQTEAQNSGQAAKQAETISNITIDQLRNRLAPLIKNTEGLINTLKTIDSIGASDRMANVLLEALNWLNHEAVISSLVVVLNTSSISNENVQQDSLQDMQKYNEISVKVLKYLFDITLQLHLNELNIKNSVQSGMYRLLNEATSKHIKDSFQAEIVALDVNNSKDFDPRNRLDSLIRLLGALKSDCESRTPYMLTSIVFRIVVPDMLADITLALDRFKDEADSLKKTFTLDDVDVQYKASAALR